MIPMIRKEEFYELVASRKSIRKFKKAPVPREVIERILAAGMQAPSGKNRQNWRFYVVQGKKRDEYLKYSQKSWLGIKSILQQRLKPSLYQFTERFFFTLGDAPVLLFCYSYNTSEEKYLTSIGSVYMAVENMNLAALVEGLGCCTMGAPLEIKNEVDEFLGVTELPEYKAGELELLCGMVLGYPDHEPPKAARQTEGRITWLE
ncbi:MAG: nitroreductase family protein [Pseudobdellovibrionaceae bacterium]